MLVYLRRTSRGSRNSIWFLTVDSEEGRMNICWFPCKTGRVKEKKRKNKKREKKAKCKYNVFTQDGSTVVVYSKVAAIMAYYRE